MEINVEIMMDPPSIGEIEAGHAENGKIAAEMIAGSAAGPARRS